MSRFQNRKKLFKMFSRTIFHLTGSYYPTSLLISFPDSWTNNIFVPRETYYSRAILSVRYLYIYIYKTGLLSFAENLISSLDFSVSNDDGSFIICDLITSGNMVLLTTIKNRQAIIRRLMDGLHGWCKV